MDTIKLPSQTITITITITTTTFTTITITTITNEGGDLRAYRRASRAWKRNCASCATIPRTAVFPITREYDDQASGDVRKRRRAPGRTSAPLDCVLVWKYDRFARTLGALIAELQRGRAVAPSASCRSPGCGL